MSCCFKSVVPQTLCSDLVIVAAVVGSELVGSFLVCGWHINTITRIVGEWQLNTDELQQDWKGHLPLLFTLSEAWSQGENVIVNL